MSFAVDTRERDCMAAMDLSGWQVKTLPVGDFILGLSGEMILPGAILIERKRADDLESSMRDGRYREQRTRLQEVAKAAGAHILYILEGSLDRPKAYFPKEVTWKWLDRLLFVHKIPIYQTKDTKETVNFLRILAEKWKEDYEEFRDGKQTEYITTIKHGGSKGDKRDNPYNFAVTVLTCCKGISVGAGEAILKKFGSLEKIFACSEEELAAVVIGKMKLGKAKAKKLYELLHAKNIVEETPVSEEVTKPKETKPKETKPKETKPKETKPKETKPKETKKKISKPQDYFMVDE